MSRRSRLATRPARIGKRLAEILGIEEEAVADIPRTLNELGADSLDMVELVMELENEFE